MKTGGANFWTNCFSLEHFPTANKLTQFLQAVEKTRTQRLALSLVPKENDRNRWIKNDLGQRLVEIKNIVARLSYRAVKVELILPHLIGAGETLDLETMKKLYRWAAETKARLLWIDAGSCSRRRRLDRATLRKGFRALTRVVHACRPRMRLGLIAPLDNLSSAGLEPREIASWWAWCCLRPAERSPGTTGGLAGRPAWLQWPPARGTARRGWLIPGSSAVAPAGGRR